MPILNKGTDFANNDQVTSAKLDNLVDAADFTNTSGTAVDSSGTTGTCVSDGGLEVTDPGGQLQIKASGVTKDKIENVADMKVLGNTSGSATAPQEVTINDTDDMSDASATTLATSESIKAYVDSVATGSTAIYRTTEARSATIGGGELWQAWTELYDPQGLGAWSNEYYQFASTGTYLVEADLLIYNDTSETNDTFNPKFMMYNGSTLSNAFYTTNNNGAGSGSDLSVQSYPWQRVNYFYTSSRSLSFVLKVENTTTAQLAIKTLKISGLGGTTGWQGAGTFKVTKLSDSLI